jgi:hypothetical protein
MFKFSSLSALFLSISSLAASAQAIPLRDVTADGTWDCKDSKGANVGAIALAEKTYAFIKPDGRVAGYGKLFIITEGYDLPHFAMVSGYLKEQLGSQGFGMRGPVKTPHDLSGEIYLNVILSPSGDGAQDWDCIRRKAPAT